MQTQTDAPIETPRCVHCGKPRSRHHVRRSDGYVFLACWTLSEIRAGQRSTYYLETPAPRSDAEIFGVEGGENYAPALSTHRAEVMLGLYKTYGNPTQPQVEYVQTFLRVPHGSMWFSQYETMEYLWLGERAA